MLLRSRPIRPVHLHGGWWLLVGAWFCATLPAAVWIDLLHSARAAMAFSHQAKLAAEVSALLHAPSRPVTVAPTAAPVGPKKSPPAAEASVRRFELPLLAFARLLPCAPAATFSAPVSSPVPPRLAFDVPHPPPRG